MDFVTLATATSSGTLLRNLAEDDDFENLSPGAAEAGGGDEYDYGDEPRPLLTPAAEAELFLLATNFLLCELLADGLNEYDCIVY